MAGFDGRARGTGAALPLGERAVFANEQVQMSALFVGKLEKNLLALGILEAFAVPFEELVRSALAPNADEQRLLIVDALPQLLGALGEQAACGPFEEQERRTRLEQRVLGKEVAIALLERVQVVPFFAREALEDAAAPGVFCEARGARVELEAAALVQMR